jgi:hypothetical protein
VGENQIHEVTFRPVVPAPDGAAEGGHALFIALEVPDPPRLLGFLEEVVMRFKAARMSGPPDARFMLITLVGDVSAVAFAQAWHGMISNDAPARALLGALHQADVMQGDARGCVLGQASLLAS